MNGAGPSNNPGGTAGPTGPGGSTGPGGQPSNNHNTPLSPENIKAHRDTLRKLRTRSTNITNRLETVDRYGRAEHIGEHFSLLQQLAQNEADKVDQITYMRSLGIAVQDGGTPAERYLHDNLN
jgi:hypothetical protein